MKIWIALILSAATITAVAQTTYRWVDKEGKVHYSGLPPSPAEAQKVEPRKSSLLGTDADPAASYTLRQAMSDYPVTLFTRPECGDPCKMGKDFLNRRGIPFTEKIIATEADLTALRPIFGEDKPAVVPVIQVGRKTLKGFNTGEWDNLLNDAGYPKAPAKPPISKTTAER